MKSSETKTLSARAYELLKSDILDMNLRPGEVLMVQSLSTQLQISRTPVKEALVRLAQEGLIEPTDGRRYRVASLNMSEIIEIYDIRIALESMCGRITASIISKEQIEELQTIQHDIQKAMASQDFHTMFAKDSRFHNSIIDIAGKKVVKDILGRLGARIQRIRFLNTHVPGRLDKTIDEHRRILEALADHDADAVESALTGHLKEVKTVIGDLLENRKFEFPQLRWVEIVK
jgi:GntR family transcriptional regulator, rspAB operon transcriptional repressor